MVTGGTTLPAGSVTFVFTDIEQSTRLLRRLGDRYPDVLDRHFELLDEAWSRYGGHELDTAGDSDFVAFADASAAVAACADAQRALEREPWPDGPLRVRMGIHCGLASPRGETYVALAVHQAARVMSAAHGGQVLVSADVADRITPDVGVELRPVGSYRLRDFDGPAPLFQLAADDLPSDFPAVRALPADGHNLVAPPDPFVGRAGEVAEIAEAVTAGLLVTLTGPGGVGKTRLAIEVGLAVASRWPDGVWLVDLGAIQEATQIPAAIGTAIGAAALGGDRWDDVIEHLRRRQTLLVLDNCEHLGREAAFAADRILTATPGTCVLATSRTPLGLRDELVWRVAPLALPSGAADAAASPAVELFLDRARTIRRDLTLDASTAPLLAEICTKVDGLPLALELAAARLGALSLQQLLDGLDDRFRLLRSRNPTLPERQRTMEALLEWSDRLLSDDERACLRRLGVFGDSFSVEAATAAVGHGDVDEYDVPELLWSLVEKSLVVGDLTANSSRYRLLESIRAFARRQLAAAGETGRSAQRLADWYLARIGPNRPPGRGWVGDTGVELANLRALVPLVADEAPATAQMIGITIGRYLDSTTAFREGLDEVERLVAQLETPTPELVSLLTCLSDLHLRTGDLDGAAATIARAEQVRAAVGSAPPWDDVGLERSRGDLLCRSGAPEEAVEAARRTLRGSLTPRGRARMHSQLGIASLEAGDLDTARDAFEAELAAYEEIGDESFEASAHGNVAEIALRSGDRTGAARHQRASLALALELGMPAMVAFSLIVAARLTAADGAWASAARLHAQAEVLLDRTGLTLYDEDRRVSNEMLASAEQALGPDAFQAAVVDGAGLDLTAAAELADSVLAEASRR